MIRNLKEVKDWEKVFLQREKCPQSPGVLDKLTMLDSYRNMGQRSETSMGRRGVMEKIMYDLVGHCDNFGINSQ